MTEKKKLAELSKEELIEEVLKAKVNSSMERCRGACAHVDQAATSQDGTGSKGFSVPKRLAGLNKAFKGKKVNDIVSKVAKFRHS